MHCNWSSGGPPYRWSQHPMSALPAAFSICVMWYSSCKGDRSVRPSNAALRNGAWSATYIGAVSYSSETRSTCTAGYVSEISGGYVVYYCSIIAGVT